MVSGGYVNQQESIEVEKISKGQIGIIVTLLSSLATTIYGYGSVTTQLDQTVSLVRELREDVRGLQETKFITNEAIRQIAELKLMIGKLEGRITYIERDGFEILAGARQKNETPQVRHTP